MSGPEPAGALALTGSTLSWIAKITMSTTPDDELGHGGQRQAVVLMIRSIGPPREERRDDAADDRQGHQHRTRRLPA